MSHLLRGQHGRSTISFITIISIDTNHKVNNIVKEFKQKINDAYYNVIIILIHSNVVIFKAYQVMSFSSHQAYS